MGHLRSKDGLIDHKTLSSNVEKKHAILADTVKQLDSTRDERKDYLGHCLG
jgi:hypothetical protein